MSVKMALVANFLSALSCYVGLVIGISVGHQADVRFWIFAIAAGIFLYVSLVDMVRNIFYRIWHIPFAVHKGLFLLDRIMNPKAKVKVLGSWVGYLIVSQAGAWVGTSSLSGKSGKMLEEGCGNLEQTCKICMPWETIHCSFQFRANITTYIFAASRPDAQWVIADWTSSNICLSKLWLTAWNCDYVGDILVWGRSDGS